MSRVLAIGWELPEYKAGDRIEAANYRTWQLVEALRGDGHEVCLAAGRIEGEFPSGPLPRSTGTRLIHVPIRFTRPGWIGHLQKIHDTFQPDCVVGITTQGGLRATRIQTSAPQWIDIYGDPTAEKQTMAYLAGNDRGVATMSRFVREVLSKGDVFSACGGPQRHALIGQLAMAGRLNHATFGYEFVHVIPPSPVSETAAGRGGALRGTLVPSDSHVALWCGGYNFWTDVDILYHGLEAAMEGDPRLHFVSVGAAVKGCTAYDRFAEMVRRSSRAERFHLLGWQPISRVPDYYADADLAITLDAACYEAELGTRTRLVEMMQYGLPIVTTPACELSYAIRDEGLGLTFLIGDWQQMGRQILELSLKDERRRQMGERARDYAASTLSLGSSTAPLRAWVPNARRAPDRRQENRNGVFSWRYSSRTLLRRALWSLAGLDH